jgi:hypothetical protein
MRSLPLLCALALTACDDGGPSYVPVEGSDPMDAQAPGAHDAGALDAGAEPLADATVDAGPPERRTWVASLLQVPVTDPQADELGLDLDGDGEPDNHLGRAYAALVASTGGFDLQGVSDQLVARGSLILLFEALASSFSDAPSASGRALQGGSPSPAPCTDESDLVCGHHLDGSGTFVAESPAPAYASGSVVASLLTIGPGSTRMPVLFSDTPTWVKLERAFVRARVTDERLLQGHLAGAIPAAEISDVVIPQLHGALSALVVRDCPDGMCKANSAGASVLMLFDADDNLMLELGEVRDASMIQTLFEPDIDLDGDGSKDALSAALGFVAPLAAFEAP